MVVVVAAVAVASTATTTAKILKKINFCSIHYVGIEIMGLMDGHMTRIHVCVKKAYK